MQLRAPSLLPVDIKGARGLAFGDAVAYALRPAIFEVAVAEVRDTVVLEAGKETKVDVPVPDLPANADVRSVRAALIVAPEEPAEPAEPISVTVRRRGEAEQSFQLGVSLPPGPRNLTIRLDQGQPFWSHGGTLAPGRHDLPDFAPQLNDYLDRADGGRQPVVLRFLVTSEARGTVRLEVDQVRFSQLQTQTWANPLDDTIRLDRNVELGFAAVERLALDPIRERQPPLVRTTVRMDLGGELGAERLLGAARGHDGRDFGTVTVDYALAQRLEAPVPLRMVGLVAFLRCAGAAEVYAEVAQGTIDGPEPRQALATANAQLDPAATGQGSWEFLALDTPSDLQPGTSYWVVLKGVRGTVAVGLQSGQVDHLGQLLVNRGGRRWRSLGHPAGPPVTALLGLVYLPGPDNQTAALEIGLEGGQPPQRMDLGNGVRTISLDAAALDASRPVTVVIRSNASGTLSIANVLQEYERAGAKESR
jgi:hypothetical protein